MEQLIAAIAYFLAFSSYTGELPRQDINCIARAVYHEARGEPVMGQIAVAHVILNRAHSGTYSQKICEVVYQPNQFTGLSPATSIDYSSPEWGSAIETAIFSYTGFVEDPTHGAQWYYAQKKIDKPKWAEGKKLLTKINGHTFLGRKGHQNVCTRV